MNLPLAASNYGNDGHYVSPFIEIDVLRGWESDPCLFLKIEHLNLTCVDAGQEVAESILMIPRVPNSSCVFVEARNHNGIYSVR